MTEGPLQDLKILDFSTLFPGPCATMILADLGADVLWVESPHRPDMVRELKPHGFETLFRNKRSLCIDLQNPDSRQVIDRLIKDYDVVLESFRPGVMERLGFDYKSLKLMNPSLIYCSCTGFGQDSPLAERGVHDINLQALSGILSLGGTKKHGPPIDGIPWADLTGGTLFILSSLLSAIHYRSRTGEGQYLDVSMLDGALFTTLFQTSEFINTGSQLLPEEDLLNGGTHYGIYQTGDGRYLSVGSLEPPFLKALSEGLGEPAILEADDLKRRQLISARILERSLEEWMMAFEEIDACVEPVLSLSEALSQPHVQARDTIVDVPDQWRIKEQIAHPVRYSKTPPDYRNVGPKRGEGSREALLSCGFQEADLKEYEKKGIFGEDAPF